MYTIYKATNIINGKSYIGFTKDFTHRKTVHKSNALVSKINTVFYKAIRKHGWESFSWKILKEVSSKKEETQYIIEHNTHYLDGYGYNMTYGGEGELGNKSRTNMPHSQQTKQIISDKNKGKSAWNRTPYWLVNDNGERHFLESAYHVSRYGLNYNTLRAYRKQNKKYNGWYLIPYTTQ